MAQIRFVQTDENGHITGAPLAQVQQVASSAASDAVAQVKTTTPTELQVADGRVVLILSDGGTLSAALPAAAAGPTVEDHGDGTSTITF